LPWKYSYDVARGRSVQPPSRGAGNSGSRNSSLQKKYHDTGRGLKTPTDAAATAKLELLSSKSGTGIE
jgi:hypothetical protein